MAKSVLVKYECNRYPNLSFYVDGAKKKFAFGIYETSLLKEKRVLEKLDDVVKVSDSNTGDKDD